MATSLSTRQYSTLYAAAFLIRALLFLFIIKPGGFYKQADSLDYHNCALSMATGNGMHRLDSREPIFWRTPGYPPYLAAFYRFFGLTSARFEDSSKAQEASIWVQIAFSSCIPLILFSLAMTITSSTAIATVLAWLSVLHPGIALSSTYILTEGLALIFFYLFLLFLYRYIFGPQKRPYQLLLIASLSLSAYTWMRPMGEFIGIFSMLFIAIGSTGAWRLKLGKGLFFGFVFFATLFPWYMRNYNLTGEWFFCPTIGTYLNVFSVPKILRRTLKRPIEQCHAIAQQGAARFVQKKRTDLEGTGLHVSHSACKNFAYPIVMQHPFYFMYDWIAEAIKTTFDLYSYQFIPMINGSFWYDPIEEYLPEKIAACLWAHEMPLSGRLICWLEFVGMLFIWIGLLGGLWVFVITNLVRKKAEGTFAQKMFAVWLYLIPMIGLIVGMTGGFGYARLRLPAEPLILILSFSFWYWLSIRGLKEKTA